MDAFSLPRGLAIVLVCLFQLALGNSDIEDSVGTANVKIDGKVVVPFISDTDWVGTTRVMLDGGDFMGFLKSDGSFSISNVPTGSYIVEIANPTYAFEPARIDVNSKGKIRARRVNNLQPSSVNQLTYPLKFKARGKSNYFQQREQWRITDMLFNPMVMMMVLPFLMIMVLPKLINTADPETQKEMQSQMNLLNPKQNFPEMSELLAGWFGGGQPAKKAVKPKPSSRGRK